MTWTLFLFRPEPGWTRTADSARAMGLTVDGAPLFGIEPVAWEAPEPSDFDGLLIGSANVFRYAGAPLTGYRKLPVFAVGEETARTARATGFEVAATGAGGLQRLLNALASRPLRLLRLTGEERVSLTPPSGIVLDERAVYRAESRPLDRALGEQLANGGVAALHSGEAARFLAVECARLGIGRARMTLAVLAPRIGELAGEGWRSVYIAERPTGAALLALAKALCQTDGTMGMDSPRERGT